MFHQNKFSKNFKVSNQGTLYFSWSQIYVRFFWNNLVNPRFSLAHNTSLPFMVPLSSSAITRFRLFLQTTNLFTFRGPTLPHLSHIIIKTNSWNALKPEIFTDITDNEHPQGTVCQIVHSERKKGLIVMIKCVNFL